MEWFPGISIENVSSRRVRSLPVRNRFAPALEHSMAIALPIPDDEPVTSIVLFSSEKGLYSIYRVL
jgi:hypothetical protein